MVVAHDQVIEHADIDERERVSQPASDEFVGLRGFGDARWVIVREDERGCVVLKRLAHDFVVRDFAVFSGLGTARTTFRSGPGWEVTRMSVAAFVQDRRTGEIHQAVATRACS